jgi:class 3 adenylate cyclase/tetratricopeptide (TPR) repeat protein
VNEGQAREGRVTTATVLFCDLVGSTAQRTALGDDSADRLAITLDRLLRGAVAAWNGRVVKSTGDGVMAVFDAASDALSAAIAIQQETERRNRGTPEPQRLRLRIGLSAGDVRYVANDCHGTPVVEAARLESVAEPGTIYASALVRLLAGSRGGHRFEPLGPLDLKGLPAPVEAHRVPWDPADDSTLPPLPASGIEPSDRTRLALPGRLSVRPPSGVVGYEPELRAMADAFERVLAGDGREIVLVAGEAGQGKSTVAAEVARAAHDRGSSVLFGHCEEDLATPYQMFAEPLAHWVRQASAADLRAHVAAFGGELVRLVPSLAARIPDLPPSRATDAETERFLLFAAVTGLLRSLSERDPIVLVLDDLQWADKGSLVLLAHLAAGDIASRLLIIATFRDSELAHAEALRVTLGVLYRHPGVSRVDLGGLDDAGVVALMEAIAGYSLRADEIDLARAVHRETDGNPFFVTQVLQHLVESGSLYQDSTGRWVTGDPVDRMALPDTVREVIGGRVVRLGPSAGRVLALAAVIGRDFDVALLATAAALPEDEVLDLLDAAAAAALVRESADLPGHYSFAHALIQHTLYEASGPTRRARAHRQVGAALEAVCGATPQARVGELARHWTLASPVDLPKAIEYSRQAGDAALQSLAPSDALLYYERALELMLRSDVDAPVLAIDLAIGLGTAQRQVGNPAFRATLLDAARQAIALADTPRLVAAALATHRGMFSNFGAIDEERVAVFEECLSRIGLDDPHRALILAAYCQEVVVGTSLERRQQLADEAFAVALACQDDEILVRVMTNTAYALIAPPMLATQLERTAEGRSRAERLGDPVLEFFACNWRRGACAQIGALAEMDRCTERMAELAVAIDQPLLTWVHTFSLAWLAMIRGETDAAERLATEALAIGAEGGQPDAEFIFGGQLMMVHHQRGTLDALSPLMEDMAAGTPALAGVLSGALAIADIEAGRSETARARLQDFADRGFELEMNPVWVSGMSFHAEAAIELGDAAFCGPIYERFFPWSDQWTDNGATATCPIAHYLGGCAAILGRYDEADEWFAQSARMCDSVGAEFFRAQTDLLWGRMHATRGGDGDADMARELLLRARDAAIAGGYGAVEERARAALERLT